MELVQGKSTYYLRIVPTLWLLTQRRNNKIFQRKWCVPEIVDEILAEWNIENDWHVDRASYPEVEYRVQYDESFHGAISRPSASPMAAAISP